MLRNLVRKYPVLIQALQAGTLLASGDVISQFVIEKKELKDFSWIRPARFFGIGFVLVGPTFRVWLGFLDRRFGSKTKTAVLKKVALDQLVFAPSFLALFLAVVGVSQRKQPKEIKEHLKNDYVDIILTAWTVWPAVQIVNFSFVPLHHQVLVVQVFALFWNTYLSWKTNRENTTSFKFDSVNQ